MSEIGIKGPSGLGDAVYLYPIVKYFAEKYDRVHVMTKNKVLYEAFDNVVPHPHLKSNTVAYESKQIPIKIRFSYGARKHKPFTSQYEDLIIWGRREYPELPDLPLDMPWKIKNEQLIAELQMVAKGRKIALVAAPYQPFGRTDKWGEEIKIAPEAVQSVIDKLKKKNYLCVAVGNEFCLHEPIVEHNLIGRTTVTDLIDLAFISDIIASQVGNLLPIAEVFKKKNIILFSAKGPKSQTKFLRQITPAKVVHFKNINLSFYDNDESIEEKVSAFCK